MLKKWGQQFVLTAWGVTESKEDPRQLCSEAFAPARVPTETGRRPGSPLRALL